jgi:hypothetical protein
MHPMSFVPACSKFAYNTPAFEDREDNRQIAVDRLPRLPANCRNASATIMLSHGIPPVIVAGMPGHSISIPLVNTYAHFIPTMQDHAAQPARKSSSLGFAAKYAAQLMDDILTPILIKLLSQREIVSFHRSFIGKL